MVGVGEDYLGAAIVQILRAQRFDGRLRAYRHENGRFHGPVRGGKNPQTGGGVAVAVSDFEVEQGKRSDAVG